MRIKRWKLARYLPWPFLRKVVTLTSYWTEPDENFEVFVLLIFSFFDNIKTEQQSYFLFFQQYPNMSANNTTDAAKPPPTYTPLTKFLSEAGVPIECRDVLKQQCVLHDQLCSSKIDEKLLRDIGIPMGHAMKIVETAQKVKSNNNNNTGSSHQDSSNPKAPQKCHNKHANELLDKMNRKDIETFAPNLGLAALKAIHYCEAKVGGIDSFKDTDPNTILLSLMDYNDNEEESEGTEGYEPNTLLSRMRNTLSALSKQKSNWPDCNSKRDEVSPRVMEAFMRKTKEYEKAKKNRRRSGQQNAFRPA